jgi:hypothetical protein
MGKYDDITPAQLRAELVRFGRLVLKMEETGILLERSPTLLKMLGELRQMLFAYEVMHTGNLVPTEEKRQERERLQERILGPRAEEEDAMVRESLRVVREALEREQELQDEIEDGLFSPDDDDED